MATNKNQHFVPKVYLRPFTKDGAGRAINVFNIDRECLIRNASVRHQCSGNYFYGDDPKLEGAIQLVERAYGTVVRELQEEPLELTDLHRLGLKRFWILQHLRTEAAAKRAVEMWATAGDDMELMDENFRLSIRDAVQIAMRTYAQAMEAVDDLDVCVLRNRTEIPFVTSDDPAIASNRWHVLDGRTLGAGWGLHSAGFVFLLPIGPRLLCLGYDSGVYSVDNRRGFVNVRRDWDVERLNEHQYLNCRANIFVQSEDDASLIAMRYREVKERRPEARWRLHYAVRDDTNDVAGCERFVVIGDPAERRTAGNLLVHFEAVHPVPSAWPSLLRWRINGRVFTNGTGVGYVRRAYAEAEGGFWTELSRVRMGVPRRLRRLK